MNGLELLRKLADLTQAQAPEDDVLRAVREWMDGGYQGAPIEFDDDVTDGIWLCLCPDRQEGWTNTARMDDDECHECGSKQPHNMTERMR